MRYPPVRSHLTVRCTRGTTSRSKQIFSTFQQKSLHSTTSTHDVQHRSCKTSPHEQSLINEDSSSHLGLPTQRRSNRLRTKIGSPATEQKSLQLVQQHTLAPNEQIVPLTGNPFFITILSKSPFHLHKLAVPRQIQKLMPCACISAFLSCGSKTWEVKYHGNRVFKRFSNGWRKFVTDNSLGGEDGCVFELMDRENLHFKVQILRAMVPAAIANGGRKDTPILVD